MNRLNGSLNLCLNYLSPDRLLRHIIELKQLLNCFQSVKTPLKSVTHTSLVTIKEVRTTEVKNQRSHYSKPTPFAALLKHMLLTYVQDPVPIAIFISFLTFYVTLSGFI